MNKFTSEQILNFPMNDNDSGANTIRGYLVALLVVLWDEGEGFSGKRPFGNSGWEWDVFVPLINFGAISGELEEDDGYTYIVNVDDAAGDKLIREAIQALGRV